jgi:hypothetical protein
MADPDPVSLVGESGVAKRENGDSSRNQLMSRSSLLFQPFLHR